MSLVWLLMDCGGRRGVTISIDGHWSTGREMCGVSDPCFDHWVERWEGGAPDEVSHA